MDGNAWVLPWAHAQGAQCLQTHLSYVLLWGEFAYKIKKAVDVGFIDFRALSARQAACQEELRLNRRLAPQLYLDVIEIRGTPAAPTFGGDGPLLEVAVRMRRFDAQAAWDARLAQDRLTVAEVDQLAQRIARFHQAAAVAPAHSPWRAPQRLGTATQAVLARLAQWVPAATLAPLIDWVSSRRSVRDALATQRALAGWVREGHGDLHLANLVTLDDGPTAFDAIEFDPALRWADVIEDIGFAVMDLMARGRPAWGWRLLNAYLDVTGDDAALGLLPDIIAYRALVRCMVAHLSAAAGPPAHAVDARTYQALASHWARARPAPQLVITYGLSGSGKSTAALQWACAAGARRLRSDVERKRLFGLAAGEDSSSIAGGIYTAQATANTYAALLARADTVLGAGFSVVVDAACLRRAERAPFAALARQRGALFSVLVCEAPLTERLARVQARRAHGHDPSEADEALLIRQQAWAEPPTPDEGLLMAASAVLPANPVQSE